MHNEEADPDMSDATIPQKADAETKPPARKRGGGLKRPEVARTPRDDDEPTGWSKVFGILLDLDRRGEVGHVIERWPVTSLGELRDAIEAAIEIVDEAGGADISLDPIDIVVAHYPRSEGKPYRVSINTPMRSASDG